MYTICNSISLYIYRERERKIGGVLFILDTRLSTTFTGLTNTEPSFSS